MCILWQLDKLTGVEREREFVFNLTNRYVNSCFPAFYPTKLCAMSEPCRNLPWERRVGLSEKRAWLPSPKQPWFQSSSRGSNVPWFHVHPHTYVNTGQHIFMKSSTDMHYIHLHVQYTQKRVCVCVCDENISVGDYIFVKTHFIHHLEGVI